MGLFYLTLRKQVGITISVCFNMGCSTFAPADGAAGANDVGFRSAKPGGNMFCVAQWIAILLHSKKVPIESRSRPFCVEPV